MATSIRNATFDDLSMIAALAAEAQMDPNRFCAYFGEEAASIGSDIADVAGPTEGPWTDATWVATDDDGALLGWVLAETDPEMGRVWWWGPVLPDSEPETFAALADRLFETALATLSDFNEHELALDSRSDSLAAFAERHGFTLSDASAMLTTAPFVGSTLTAEHSVVPIAQRHHRSVSALHDRLFPGTHTLGARIVEADREHLRLVIEDDDGANVIGYVATELQSDASLYIDYLGVAPDQRRRGVGRRLVTEAMRLGADAGATHAHLTVGTSNPAALELYRSLGFIEERILVPYRRGFALG